MLLQNDKQTLTLDRDRASRILYNDESVVPTTFPIPETTQMFNNNHDFAEYNKLVQTEYQGKTATQELHEVNFEKYYNDTNPVPQAVHQSYRAKVLTDFPDFKVDTCDTVPAPSLIDETQMEKVAETNILDIAAPNTAQVFEDVEIHEPYLRLNAKGLIACVAFVTITALIAVLVIMNTIAIGSSGTRIDNLKAENSALTAEYNEVMLDRDIAFNENVILAGGTGGVPAGYEELPSTGNYELAPVSSDYSTNLFDQICKFLSKLFS